MEVLSASTTGRPRFVPTKHIVMPSASATMTRSPISHNNNSHSQQQQTCSSNGQSSVSSSDTRIRDKTKLLQLAEKVHTRKSATPSYTKSFRGAISSVVSKSGNSNDDHVPSTPSVRRTNSTMLTSSAPSGVSRSKVENYKNPKLYASFSSKSCSKLTKALIRSDPAKTNIEHLVNYKSSPPKAAETHSRNGGGVSVNGKRLLSENGENTHASHHHNNNGSSSGGGGLSSFITPLKALHASFHERSSKLGQTRSKLFSHHRDISSSNAKLLFGTTENLHSSSSCTSSSSEDILSVESSISSKPIKSGFIEQRPQRQVRNNKRVATRAQLQNGHNGTVPPDFLEGFRNENSCKIDKDNDAHAANNSINRNDRVADCTKKNGHEKHETSKTNSMNSFNTPDILGGCFDVPQPTRQQNGHHCISENDQKLLDDLREINGRNYSSEHRGEPVNGECVQQQVVQQHFDKINDISQKRKNIVVRMSYHDEASYDDLYRTICTDNANVDEDTVMDENLIWPTSPITVSTVTPKSKQLIFSNDVGGVSSRAEVITRNNYSGENSSSNNNSNNTLYITSMTNGTKNVTHNISNSFCEGNSSNAFLANGSSTNNGSAGGGGVAHLFAAQQRHHRPVSSLSTVSNSSELRSKEKEKCLQLAPHDDQQKMRRSSSSAGKRQQLLVSSQQSQEENHSPVHSQSHSPEASGSSTWLQTKYSSSSSSPPERSPNGLSSLKENDITKAYLNGEENTSITQKCGKKQILKKASSSTLVVGNDKSLACSTANGEISQYYNENGNEDDETDEFAVIIPSLRLSNENGGGGEKGRGGRSQRGLLMEGETSFSQVETQKKRNVSRRSLSSCGSGRPQTALLSDEYAQYLGYDYDNDNDKVEQAQTRLHVRQLGNKCSVVPSKEMSGENGGGGDDHENLTMLAITTKSSGHNKNGNVRRGVHYQQSLQNGRQEGVRKAYAGIMKPQHGKIEEELSHHPQHKPIVHSVSFSFRGTDSDGKWLDDKTSRLLRFDRKRSRSLPKSFLSVRNGLRNVLPSHWVRDEVGFQRLNDHETSCPANLEEREEQLDAVKMRWHKLGSPPSSSAASFSDRRPKSFDYAQRKAWMKLYRDMEVSQASGNAASRSSRPISKGSITHLHLQEVSSDPNSGHSESGDDAACRCALDSGSRTMSASTMLRSSDISSTSPSLFKRFSKTFSLRFGSGSNVSKNAGDVHRKSKGGKGAVGSSPDLLGRLDADSARDKVNGKMRQSNVKSVRGDKCQSGDSGIGIEDQQTEPRHVSNLRRIRSDYISPNSVANGSSPASNYASRGHPNGSTATLTKLSLVEIPDHSWDEHNASPNEGSGSSDTASYEDLVDAKLDGDDGFSSSDERQHEKFESPSYYHSLPHRKHKRRLKTTDSANSCGEVPREDNSIRGKVVREIIHTEQNYVKTLNDIVQGFLNPCRARNDLFSSRTVQNIFSNIEDILRLHVKFLEALKSQVDQTFVSRSNVGEVFTSWADKFGLYSEYCCNNPISVATVRSLVQFSQYAEFFEACRRLQMMDKLPLHGFLLRPIQRICQYHLQLNELLKHTEESHIDHQSVVEALETMKSVATKINDTQRQFESLQEIIRLQNSVDGWEGPNLVDRNAAILRKGELVKVTQGRKHKEVFVAVLNKDLIYCKKDFMKKNGYVFDGRIDLNLRMWVNIDSNEEDEFFGMVHNSWRIYSPERRAWILFTAPTPTEKRKWICALENTTETITIDHKLREMAVVTTALADTELMANVNSHGHHSNTLPKSSKKSKGKHLTVTKVDSDAMLIEVGKLKRSTVYANPTPSQREGTSKFYV